MPDTAPTPELLRSLGRLVRGLSALFWGLPLALILCTGTANAGWFSAFGHFGFVPSMVATGMVLFGLWQLGAFQKQERPWRSVLDRARLFALINFGLSPFLFWWNRHPEQPFFSGAACVFVLSALLFLCEMNYVLQRLGAMLPDETLRQETRQYTWANRLLLIILLVIAVGYVACSRLPQWFYGGAAELPDHWDLLSSQVAIPVLGLEVSSFWLVWLLVCLFVLLPLSMTMALIWKTKEVILDSVFGGK